jgi:hypothetical protein
VTLSACTGRISLDSVQVRLMDEDDLQSAERASAVAFFEADRLSGRVGEPEIEPRAAAASTQWIDRMSHFLCITTANEWAVDVGLAARLAIGQEGYLAGSGMKDPAPYLASGHFL